VSGCGGNLSGSTYITGAINSSCTVTANFSVVSNGGVDDIGDCTVPSNVEVADSIDIYQSTQTTEELNDQIRSFPFTTNSSTSAQGEFSTAYTTNSPASRIAWISTCPGDSLADAEAELGWRCTSSSGFETTVLRWAQADGRSCVLDQNKTYYFNVKNATTSNFNGSTCPGSNCPFYFQRNLWSQ
jgi:hypothetical protein